MYYLLSFREFKLLVLITEATIKKNARQPRPQIEQTYISCWWVCCYFKMVTRKNDFTQCGEDEIESKLSSQIFSTLTTRKKYLETDFFSGPGKILWTGKIQWTCVWIWFLGNRCLDMVLGNRCWETGVWLFWGETGVGKRVSGYGSRKQVSGNRCLDSCWKQVLGNRCLDSCWKQVSGNRRLDSVWKQVSGNRCLEINCLETDVFSHLGNSCHWDLPVQSWREIMVQGIKGL